MASFFEKLKKGMRAEGLTEEVEKVKEVEEVEEAATVSPASLRGKSAVEKKPTRKKKILRAKKIEVEEAATVSPASLRGKSAAEEKTPEVKVGKLEIEKPEIKKPTLANSTSVAISTKKVATADKEKWPEPEGQLAIDVYQTETELVIQSAIAGVKPEDLDISMERDVLTVKGNRQKPFEENGDYFTQECYWGPFSREVILPVEIDPDRVEAAMKDGILTIRIPKLLREKKRSIKVRI
jgi:HSP20 family molecular chaperone IbpA